MNKILVIAYDSDMLHVIVDAFSDDHDAQVTVASSGGDALDLDCIESHHVVITPMHLPDMTGLSFARQILALRERPIIMIAGDPSVEEVISALRAGVCDLLTMPVDMEHLLEAIRTGLARDLSNRRQARREMRLRTVIRRVLHDRRQLNRRIELVCRDMVGAHRRLFHRVVSATNSHDRTS